MTVNVSSNLIYLAQAKTTDGNGTATPVPFNRAKVKAYGTWNGASVKLQSMTSSGTWIDITQLQTDGSFLAIAFTANNQIVLDGIILNESFRMVQSSSGMTTSITVEMDNC